VSERRPHVLIVDDEAPLRELVRVCLGPGYSYREAGSVADSLHELKREAPDVVVLDLMLIGGSGLEVLRAIRDEREFANTRVVVVSAWTDEANRQAAEEAGADAFLGKPFEPDELIDRVDELAAVGDRSRPT